MSTPFNFGTSWMHPTSMHSDTDDGVDEMNENNDDDEFTDSDDVLQENSIKLHQDLEDDNDQVENVHANNEYVKPIDSHPDEFEDDDWVNSTRVEHISSKFSRLITPPSTDDLG